MNKSLLLDKDTPPVIPYRFEDHCDLPCRSWVSPLSTFARENLRPSVLQTVVGIHSGHHVLQVLQGIQTLAKTFQTHSIAPRYTFGVYDFPRLSFPDGRFHNAPGSSVYCGALTPVVPCGEQRSLYSPGERLAGWIRNRRSIRPALWSIPRVVAM
jgi:hypothetical protein